MIDAHCHIDYIEGTEQILEEAKKKGMKAIVTSALNREEAETVFRLREKYPNFLYVCIGLHPSEIDKFTDMEDYLDFIKSSKEKIVAVGECGLDYTWSRDESTRERSRQVFIKMIELSEELKLPLVIHSRDAMRDTLDILESHNTRNVMLHCFSGSEATLKAALELGYYISFATNVCWTKKHPYLAGKTPLDKMLLETDAPWLDPDTIIEELKSESRKLNNRPWKIGKSAEKIAEVKGTTKEEVLKVTAENAARFFGLK